MKEEDWTFDDLFKSLGEFGRYQKFLYLLCSLVYTVTSMQLLGWVFVGTVPDHTCDCTLSQQHHHVGSSGNCSVTYNDTNTSATDSAVVEWGLVCERETLSASIAAAPMFGYLFGGLFFGAMSDKCGRKPAFLVANAVLVSAGVVCGLAPNYLTFLVMRYYQSSSYHQSIYLSHHSVQSSSK